MQNSCCLGSSAWQSVALVRQRSRVQIPAKALIFDLRSNSCFIRIFNDLRISTKMECLHPSLLLAEEIKPFFIDRGNSNSRNVCSFLLISLLNLYSYTFDTFSSCIHSISILDNNAGLKLLFQGIPYYSFSYFQLLLNSFFKATQRIQLRLI